MLPLSFAQRRLWFINRLEGASATYNVPVVLRLGGVPDRHALALAVSDVVRRHEVLRTVFPAVDGEPYQRILDGPGPEPEWMECVPGAVDALVDAFAHESFDITAQRPLRVRLFVTGPDESVLVLLLHHVATDGWSTGPLLRDLASAYAARSAGAAPEWEQLPVQYADYTLWQRDMLGDADDPESVLAEQLGYWRETLTEVPPVLELPTDRPRPAEPSGRGDLVKGWIDARTHARLLELARSRRASLFMVAQAALSGVLAQVSGRDDIVVGSAVAGRPEEELNDLVGFFVNSLVLRTDVSGDPAFTELLDRVREIGLAAYAHDDLPFDLLVEHLNPARSLSHHPFFQTMLTLQNGTDPGVRLGDIPGAVEPAGLRTAKFDINVFCTEVYGDGGEPGGVEVWFQYATDLFDAPTAALLLGFLTRALDAVAADPATRVTDAVALTDAERRALAERRERVAEAGAPAGGGSGEGAAGDADTHTGPEGSTGSARSPREEILCGLFAAVLGRGRIAPDDNFFRNGGHSLLGVRLINRVRSVLGVELGIRDLFLAPTPAGLDRRLDELAGGAARPALVPVERPERVPMSFAQRRLWFVNELEGPSRSYNIPVVLRLDGRLDADVLADALTDVAERHEVLRTMCGVVDGEPYQRILTGVRPPLDVVHTDEAGLTGAVDAATGQVFDLGADIPLRARLLELDDSGAQVLVVLVHHIAGDGWSLEPLLADLSAAYTARLTQQAVAWRPLPVQYADYALWQREVLGEESDPESVLARQLLFWRAALDGAPPVLELPAARTRPAVATHEGALEPFALDADTHDALARIAGESGATLFMVLQAALAVTLSRLGAGSDLPIGTVEAGRGDAALDDLVGFFVNTLVLRTDVSGDPAFTDLVARVRDTDLAAYAHQDVPFEQLVEHLSPDRSTAHHPLVQVMLLLRSAGGAAGAGAVGAGAADRSALSGSDVLFDTGRAKFDLTLALTERQDADGARAGITGVLEYATDLYDAATARLVVDCLTAVLRQVAAAPGRGIEEIDLLSAADRAALLAPEAGRVPASGARITERFARHVASDPDAVALIAGGGRMTYGELDAAANGLAHGLVGRGVGRGDVVGVLLEPGIPLVVAALATLKSGAAYVLLDPAVEGRTDDGRLAGAGGADSGLAALVCAAPAAAERLGTTRPDRVVVLDADGVAVAGSSAVDTGADAGAPPLVGDASDAAYVLPGSPAALFSHRAVVAAATDRALAGPTSSGGRPETWLQHAPVTSGRFALELWGPLLTGAACVLWSGGSGRPEAIASLVIEHDVTATALPGRVFDVLVDDHPEAFARLGLVITGDEAPSPGQLARAQQLFGQVRIVYGHGAAGSVYGHGGSVGNGPGAGAFGEGSRHVLDARLRPVPAGVPGDLYVAGPRTADGFPGRPGVSAACFTADPFGPAGGRMHRTGESAVRAADGTLRVLGRCPDEPPTVRGLRVEPREIEAVLTRHPSVRRAAVLLREDEPGEHRLVAYQVAAREGSPDVTAVRAAVAETLPAHWVPAEFVVLDALPLTRDGRLDRPALPAPEDVRRAEAEVPRDAREEVLHSLFVEILGGRRIGRDDNFFRVGGHSLLAVRLVNRIRSALGAELTLRDVFNAPTVATLTERLPGAGGPETAPAPQESRPTLRRRTRSGSRVHDPAVPAGRP
ncbi:condensation domain-containing protein [Streptomyces sp. NBC_01725]|uniref:condensation domain-containing protein n=1 Tax=Streptomyces sp. NBC_01725 TaxID=2975923 RepID=UPI003FCE54DE